MRRPPVIIRRPSGFGNAMPRWPAARLKQGAFVDAMLGLVQPCPGCAAVRPVLHFSDSISAVSRGFPGGWLMLVSAWSAQAEGARGDGEAAAAALRRSEEAYGTQFSGVLAGT